MKKNGKFHISLLGEFVDKSIEKDFFEYDMARCAKFVGPVVLVFGVVYMMFLIADFYSVNNQRSFVVIFIIRALFIALSIAIFFTVKKVKNYNRLVYLITVYEFMAIISFFLIVECYETYTLLLFFSVMAITLAIYIIPNKLIYSQMISIFLSLCFFIFYANHIEGMETALFLKILAYHLITIAYCNIGAYLTNYYKRRQFIDHRELLRVAITDSLTGIYNRAKFNEEFNYWIHYCNRYGNSLSLVMLDIDNFKKVNDSYGHPIGDTVLQQIAETVKNAIRNTDVIARWGGEEFVILLPNTDLQQTKEMMERIRICIEKNKYADVANVTCSFGLVALEKNESMESMLQRVDKFLYIAKNSGKNMIVCEESKITDQVKLECHGTCPKIQLQ